MTCSVKPDDREVTPEMVTAAMREFEKYAARLLRYPEAQRWHMNDVLGMREAIKAALRADDEQAGSK